jgi:hypothetical protein
MMSKKGKIKAGILILSYPMWDARHKIGAGRPAKKSTIIKALWKGYPSIKAMREAKKLRKVM